MWVCERVRARKVATAWLQGSRWRDAPPSKAVVDAICREASLGLVKVKGLIWGVAHPRKEQVGSRGQRAARLAVLAVHDDKVARLEAQKRRDNVAEGEQACQAGASRRQVEVANLGRSWHVPINRISCAEQQQQIGGEGMLCTYLVLKVLGVVSALRWCKVDEEELSRVLAFQERRQFYLVHSV